MHCHHPNFIHCANGITFCWLLTKSMNSHINAGFWPLSLVLCGNSPAEHVITWHTVLGAVEDSPAISCALAQYCKRNRPPLSPSYSSKKREECNGWLRLHDIFFILLFSLESSGTLLVLLSQGSFITFWSPKRVPRLHLRWQLISRPPS